MAVLNPIATAAEREQQAVRELQRGPCGGCGRMRRRLLVGNGRTMCMECGFRCSLPKPKAERRPPVARAAVIDRRPNAVPRARAPRRQRVGCGVRAGGRDDGGGGDGRGGPPGPPPPPQTAAHKRGPARLETLASEFYAIARRDKSTDHAHIFARLNERLAAMRGWTSVNIRCDPTVAEIAERPTRHQKIREAVMRLKYGPDWKPNGGDRAVDMPSLPDDLNQVINISAVIVTEHAFS